MTQTANATLVFAWAGAAGGGWRECARFVTPTALRWAVGSLEGRRSHRQSRIVSRNWRKRHGVPANLEFFRRGESSSGSLLRGRQQPALKKSVAVHKSRSESDWCCFLGRHLQARKQHHKISRRHLGIKTTKTTRKNYIHKTCTLHHLSFGRALKFMMKVWKQEMSPSKIRHFF